MAKTPNEESTENSNRAEDQEDEQLIRTKLRSIAPECDSVKAAYDECFQEFFPRFLAGATVDPCTHKLKVYQQCLRTHLSSMGLDMAELDASKMDHDAIAAALNKR